MKCSAGSDSGRSKSPTRASSGEEFEFVRRLIGEGIIPDGVRINVLTAARKDLIDRTVSSLAGVRQATVHCYIATSRAPPGVRLRQNFRRNHANGR